MWPYGAVIHIIVIHGTWANAPVSSSDFSIKENFTCSTIGHNDELRNVCAFFSRMPFFCFCWATYLSRYLDRSACNTHSPIEYMTLAANEAGWMCVNKTIIYEWWAAAATTIANLRVCMGVQLKVRTHTHTWTEHTQAHQVLANEKRENEKQNE